MYKNRIIIIALCFAIVMVLSPYSVMAQAVPSSADSSRIDKNIPDNIFPDVQQKLKIKDKAVKSTPIPQGAELYSFKLSNIIVNGMTVYKMADILPLYEQMIGKEVSFADIIALSDSLTVKYRNDGYILSKSIVPAQKIANGVVTLQVIEGYIDNIIIDGDKRNSNKLITGYLQQVKNSKPLNMKVLERALLLINDLSGIKARNILSPSENTTGASDLKIILEQEKSINTLMQVDNRGSRYIGPLQASTAVQLNNFLNRNETINAQFITTPPMDNRELDYASFSYKERIGRWGTAVSARGSLTATRPGFELSEFDVKGKSNSFAVVLEQPLIRSRTTNLSTSIQFDIANTKRKDNISTTKTKDRTRVLRARFDASHFDSFSGLTSGNIEFSQGMNIFGATKTGTANMTRARGVSNFSKVTAEISRTQRITDKIQLIAGIKGQKSANILLSSEEFGVGGASYGKAYDGSEITGENGLAGKLELHLYNPYSVDFLDSYQFYTWYDIGKVWDRDNNIIKDKQRSIASAGIGFQSNIGRGVSLITELAFPLTRNVDVEDNTKPRLFATLSFRF